MIASEAPIHGTCEPRFAGVREVFAENFRAFGEVGAAVSVALEGRFVVDLWGGFRDRARTRSWERDTLVCMMSVAKGVSALVAHMLVDRGLLDLDAPVARYWPEFAANGKDGVRVRHLLDHRAGLPAISREMPTGAVLDWRAMTEALAAETLQWEPGTRQAYHSVTMGFLVGEVVRRASGRTIGTYLRGEVTAPLGLDYWIGLPPNEHSRTAEFFGETKGTLFDESEPESLRHRAMRQVPPSLFNTPEFRSAEIPSINGHGAPRAIARLFGALAMGGALKGVRIISPEGLARATAVQWEGREEMLGHRRRMGLGFYVNLPGEIPMGPNPHAFGHTGAGGALGFADPDARLGFAYGMNFMYSGPGMSPRLSRLVESVYRCL